MAKTITHDETGKALWGDQDHLEAAQATSFDGMIFELLSEKKPTPEQLKVFELILNLSIDHGPDTPSAVKVMEAAKEGQTISEAVATGISQINESHGGAIEPAMEILYSIDNEPVKDEARQGRQLTINNLVEEYIKEDKKIPGLGHRVYKTADPRTDLIFQKLEEAGMGNEWVKLEKDLQAEFEKQSGKHLPINIDGAIAVVLCEFGWDSKLGKAVFIVARTPGLCGQYLNNMQLKG